MCVYRPCVLRGKCILALLLMCALAVPLIAQESEIYQLQQAVDMIWIIMAAALVFFMQAGFAMLSTGLTRAKNAGNVLMKNLMDFAVGAIAFWAIGWALMYGTDIGGFIGSSGFFLRYGPAEVAAYGADSVNIVYRDWMFQVVFAGAAATIISGAMAERLKFKAYLIYSVCITALIYPISGHWVWGGGWLGSIGFYDFAGSAVVHLVGGVASLVGAALIGPRVGKYFTYKGKTFSRAIIGHNIPLAALGTFVLWFGWYGFNAGSTLSGSDLNIATIALTTTLAASAGAIGALFTSWTLFKKPDPSMALNGALGGLVAITAGCAVVSSSSAVIIGIIAGIVVVFAVEFFDKVLRVDDPVGAISVHGVCGVLGALAVGLFAQGDGPQGLFFGGGWSQLGIQLLGVGAIILWVAVTSGVLFGLLRAFRLLRVSAEEERIGLDIGEHGVESYGGFQIFSEQ